MAERKPLVRVGGKSKQLPAGDKLPFAALPVGYNENTVAAGDDPRIVYANTPNWQGVGANVDHLENGLFTVSDPLNGPTVDYAGDTEKIWFVRDTYEVARVQTAHWASAPAGVAAESKIYVRTKPHWSVAWTPWVKLLLDAPQDSKAYTRKDGAWVEVVSGGPDVMAAKTIKGNKNAVSAAAQDLSPSEARTVLELGTAAVADTGAGPSNVILGNDSRLSDAREWSADTVSQLEAEAGTATTRRAWTAQRVRQAIAAWWAGTVGTVVQQADIGTAPNQLPLNQYLGEMAYQDHNAVQITGGIATLQLRRRAPVTKTANFTVADNEHWLVCNGTADITVTLPDAATNIGREIMLRTIAAFTVISASANVVPIAGGAAGTAILAATSGKYATLVSDGTNWLISEGN